MTEAVIENDWDYREEVRIDPCECNHECGNYILSIKGEHTHIKNVPPDEFIDVCTIPNWMLYDLMRNCTEKIDLEDEKEKLEEIIKKTPLNKRC